MATLGSWNDGTGYDPEFAPKTSPGTWWPAGKYVVKHSQLKRMLAESAQWHAQRAIQLFVSEDLNELLDAAVSAGTAVELLAKTYLATIEPVLLADKGDRDTVLIMGGRGELASVDPLLMKTISALDALRLAKYFHRELPWFQQDTVSLRVRNAAIHMALVQGDELRWAVIQMSRLVESLIIPLDLDRESFWGSNAMSVVNYLIDEDKTERARTVAAKKAAAERYLIELLQGLSDENRRVMLAVLSGRSPNIFIDHNEPQQCPVCEQQGWLICGVESGPIQRQAEEDGGFSVWAERIAYPVIFKCPVCQLHVEEDELLEFKFPRSIGIDPEDLTRDYYDQD